MSTSIGLGAYFISVKRCTWERIQNLVNGSIDMHCGNSLQITSDSNIFTEDFAKPRAKQICVTFGSNVSVSKSGNVETLGPLQPDPGSAHHRPLPYAMRNLDGFGRRCCTQINHCASKTCAKIATAPGKLQAASNAQWFCWQHCHFELNPKKNRLKFWRRS